MRKCRNCRNLRQIVLQDLQWFEFLCLLRCYDDDNDQDDDDDDEDNDNNNNDDNDKQRRCVGCFVWTLNLKNIHCKQRSSFESNLERVAMSR